MCGRYYVDDDTVREVRKLVRDLDKKLETGRVRDIHPSDQAVVLSCGEFCKFSGEGRRKAAAVHENKEVCAGWMHWGFPGYQGKGLLINARAESVPEKPAFRESILHRRCVIPAAGFYEWNRNKEKNTFYRIDHSVLWMAGCFREYQGELRFVVLTTKANESVADIHERMPLILESREVEAWIRDDRAAAELLKKIPCLLEREQEYEQMSLF